MGEREEGREERESEKVQIERAKKEVKEMGR
jgi:hypothetical protein